MLFKSTLREIKSSFGRFFAILAIVALGVGFFGGLKVTKPSMITTLDNYLDNASFFDFHLISTLGFEDEDIEKLKSDSSLSEVTDVEGSVSVDALCSVNRSDEAAFKIYSLPNKINKVYLTDGRMPEKANECLIDDYMADYGIGSVLEITENNDEDTLDMFSERNLEVVGIIRSPLYINFERGNTSIGTGKITGYIFVPEDTFDVDYYTELYAVTDAGENAAGHRFGAYTDEYDDYIDSVTDDMKSAIENVAKMRYERIVSDAKEELADAKKELDEEEAKAKKELDDAKKELEDGREQLLDAKAKVDDGRAKISDAKAEIDKQVLKMREGDRELAAKEKELEAGKAFISETEYEYALKQLNDAKHQMLVNWTKIREAKDEIEKNEAELEDGEKEIRDNEKKLNDGQKEYEDAVKEFDEKIADAKQEIAKAQDKIGDIEEPDTYVLGRDTNVGYACYSSDSDIVASVANVFPIFFLLVAILICMTTMNRMVEEQRTQIGVLKALGYSSVAIGSKYTIYAGAAALIGSVLGYILGTNLLPQAIWQGYNIMYNMGRTIIRQDVPIVAVISITIAILTAVGTAFFSVKVELQEVPANLIRPKAPKSGKRVFLEYITPLWSRMKFLSKVSARNIIRYKKRFFMMIVGISGCTALVLTGFGIGDSIKGIAELQFENIQVYDISVSFNDKLTNEDMERIRNLPETEDISFMYQASVDACAGDKTKNITVVTPDDRENLLKFLVLRESEKGPDIPYPSNMKGVITEGIAEFLGLSVEDEVILKDSDMHTLSLLVSGITENHFSSFIYLPENTYVYAPRPTQSRFNSAWINVKDGVDATAFAADLSDEEFVLNVSVTKDLEDRVHNMMAGMDFIVWVVIACAGALAFIVLYNLTNINITERVREIATIKVLGFYPLETAAYVFRENMVLTGIGAFVGIPLGILLHRFIMYNIKIDMVYFKTYIAPMSFVWGIVMTFVFAMIVNFFMFFKLGRINMAESLKSIE